MDQNNMQTMDMTDNREKPEKPGEKKGSGKQPSFLGGVVLGAVAATVIFFLINGLLMNPHRNAGEEAGGSVKVNLSKDGFVTAGMINKLESLAASIQREFYLADMTNEQLEEGLYKGMLEALEDPYSEYYTVEECQEFMNNTAGIYYGIGAYLMLDSEKKVPRITGLIENTPAEKAGLRANDLIVRVDDVETYGLTLNEAVKHIKGPEFTDVVLTIYRDSDTFDVTLTRQKVESPTVNSEVYEDGMGYLQITEFDSVTYNQFMTHMEKLQKENIRGLILDLRSNPGGNLDIVVQIAEELIPEGIVVYTEDKAGVRNNYGSGKGTFDMPLVVLVDMNSASASEILSGAIQDYKRGTLVGTTTYGKGIVQSVQYLKDGSAVKYTTSSYFTPGGRNIHKIGIEPDIVCEFDGEAYYNAENPVDNQLEKAKEILKGKLQKK